MFKSLDLIHSLISSLSFLCATTIDETQFMDSETVVIKPLFIIFSSFVLTHACIANGMQCAGLATGYCTAESKAMELVIGSTPSSSLNTSPYC